MAVSLLLVCSLLSGVSSLPATIIEGEVDTEGEDLLSWDKASFWVSDTTTPEDFLPRDEDFLDVPKPNPTTIFTSTTTSTARTTTSTARTTTSTARTTTSTARTTTSTTSKTTGVGRKLLGLGLELEDARQKVLGDLLHYEGSGEGSGWGILQ